MNKNQNNKVEGKLKLVNHVLISALKDEEKLLLVELLMRADKDGHCFPSVERLCKARGIKHEKNFKGADTYLPRLVEVYKDGRHNFYILNFEAIAALPEAEVIIKHTPRTRGQNLTKRARSTPSAVGGANTPALADNTPAPAENTPAAEGVNYPAVEGAYNTDESSVEGTGNNSGEGSSPTAGAFAPVQANNSTHKDDQPIIPPIGSNLEDCPIIESIDFIVQAPPIDLSLESVPPMSSNTGEGAARAAAPAVQRGKDVMLAEVNKRRERKGKEPIGKKGPVTPLDENHYEWNGQIERKVGTGADWTTAPLPPKPVEPEKIPCPKCSLPMDTNLCWVC